MAATQRPLLLVVEDEETAAEMTQIYFEEMGYRVLVASSAAAALALAESDAPDVLLTDVLLHGSASGLKVARQLRENHPALPIFITSGLPEDAVRAAARTITDVAVIPKPVRLSKIKAMIDGALARAGGSAAD